MAPRPEDHTPRGIYHVTLRGNDGQAIFHDNSDRHRLAACIDEGQRRFGYRVAAFCFLPDGLHLGIQAGGMPVSPITRTLGSGYTRWVNARHARSGRPFDGRCRAAPVDGPDGLLALVRRIHLGPVRAGLVESPGDWFWSGHNTCLGEGVFPWLSADWVLSRFGGDTLDARRRYLAYVEGGGLPGSPRPRTRVQTTAEPAPVERLVERVCGAFGVSRAQLLSRNRRRSVAQARAAMGWLARELPVVGLSAAANALGRDVSTLSGAAASLERRRAVDPVLRARLAALREALDSN